MYVSKEDELRKCQWLRETHASSIQRYAHVFVFVDRWRDTWRLPWTLRAAGLMRGHAACSGGARVFTSSLGIAMNLFRVDAQW